jgi:hypothetical protein
VFDGTQIELKVYKPWKNWLLPFFSFWEIKQ